MKERFIFLARFAAAWFVLFIFFRFFFLGFNYSLTEALTVKEVVTAFWRGASLDNSALAYICAFPTLLLAVSSYFYFPNIWYKILNVYTFLLCFFIIPPSLFDAFLYGFWGFRLDMTPFFYMKNFRESVSSVSWQTLIVGNLFMLSMVYGVYYLFQRFINHKTLEFSPVSRWYALVFMAITALWAIPMRGGLQQIPINVSYVFHSAKPYANHIAVNTIWNMCNAFIQQGKQTNKYHFFDDTEAKNIFEDLYDNEDPRFTRLVKPGRHNLLVIILESHTSNVIGCLGGEKGFTPNIDKIASEGVLFTNIFATGDRTERGILGVVGAYPNLPVESPMRNPYKTRRLPSIIKDAKAAGYKTAFFHGGEASFANVSAFMYEQGIDTLIERRNFDRKYYANSKWGVHDHIMYQRVIEEIECNSIKKPFCDIIMTLSSHEPFVVPMPTKVVGDDEGNKFRNAIMYADQSLGTFIRAAKTTSWWDNTLVVMVADHGSRLPNNLQNHEIAKFKIPMIWTGGALAQHGTQIHAIASQTDIAETVMRQVDIPFEDYKFSRNILAKNASNFAFFAFNDGLGFMTRKGKVVFDNTGKIILQSEGNAVNALRSGKAYLQVVTKDYEEK
jgi:phosphoglycerol transferase MdoB-like AlkP superfamily enzyme